VVENDLSNYNNDTGWITDISSDNLGILANVTITDIAPGEILKWTGSIWENNTLAEAAIADTSHTVLSHDTTGTGAELTELTDGSETALHSHAGGAGAGAAFSEFMLMGA